MSEQSTPESDAILEVLAVLSGVFGTGMSPETIDCGGAVLNKIKGGNAYDPDCWYRVRKGGEISLLVIEP